MKMKIVVLGICLCFVSVPAFGDLSGSAHDFTDDTWAGNSACEPCHTPHNGNMSNGAPLWSHALANSASFTPYGSGGTMQASPSTPTGTSLLCLSCHDGVVPLDDFAGRTPAPTLIGTVNASAEVGQILSNDHPISFAYTTALSIADGELKDPSTELTALGGTIKADLLDGDNMECSSCHDVHNTPGIAKLLRVTNAGSALCTTCHTK